MKIRLFSDLHNEFNKDGYQVESLPEDYDTVLVLAGDIDVGGAKESFLEDLSGRFKAIVYVAGNHEYYNHEIDVLDNYLEYAYDGASNIHFLDNDSVRIDDVLFYGGTAWTDVPVNMHYHVQSSMNDFRAIKKMNYKGKFTSFKCSDASKINEEFEIELGHSLRVPRPFEKVVVVSHHTPSLLSCSEEFIKDELNVAYHNNYDNFIKANPNIKLWCHGHVHDSNDYKIGDTRVVSNPYGYHDYDTNDNFEPTKVIEI